LKEFALSDIIKKTKNMSFIFSLFKERKTFLLFLFLFFGCTVYAVHGESQTSGKNIFIDADQDNLSLQEEKLYGTDANKSDTDGDGYSDGVEIESGYNPLVPAPGDRIVKLEEKISQEVAGAAEDNLTNKVSVQIAGVLSGVTDDNKEVTFDQINSAVEQAMSGNNADVVLPEVDMKEIKIKKAPSKSMKEKERKSQEKKDVLEYLTVMSYIVANNSPSQFNTEDQFGGVMNTLSSQAILGLANGNVEGTNALAERGQKILDESKKVEVPEAMVDIHVKALKMGLYAASLKKDIKTDGDDPIGQIAALSRMQALLGVTAQFVDDVQGALKKYEIDTIPLEL
jgi:predicted transcriptional regulator